MVVPCLLDSCFDVPVAIAVALAVVVLHAGVVELLVLAWVLWT